MRTPSIVILSAAVSLAAAFGFQLLRGSSNAASNAGSSANAADARVEHALDALGTRVDQLAKELQQIETRPALATPAAERLPLGEIDAAVARALAKQGAQAGETAANTDLKSHANAAKLDAHQAFAALIDPNLSRDARQAKWKEIADAGLLDEVLALYEQRAKDDPNSPKAQTELGWAYLQKIFHGASGPEAGVWGMKADKSFDKALAIDDHDWDARFTKAVSLSNWPAFLGKQGEAIKHFETLVAQQEATAAKPEFAQTYVFLGNMYQQTGHPDKALQIWQQGAALFPDNQSLAQQIANAPGH